MFSNLEDENTEADWTPLSQEKYSFVVGCFLSHERRLASRIAGVSYGQNLLGQGFFRESVSSKDVQFDLAECILNPKS